MLDQNADRMWFVIGAVILGAGLIFGVMTIYDDSLDGVDSNFDTIWMINTYPSLR